MNVHVHENILFLSNKDFCKILLYHKDTLINGLFLISRETNILQTRKTIRKC